MTKKTSSRRQRNSQQSKTQAIRYSVTSYEKNPYALEEYLGIALQNIRQKKK